MGFYDQYEYIEAASSLRIAVSLVLCLQILKCTQFLVIFFPGLGLVTGVLGKAFGDLISFIMGFSLTLLAFSQLFAMQLGCACRGRPNPRTHAASDTET